MKKTVITVVAVGLAAVAAYAQDSAGARGLATMYKDARAYNAETRAVKDSTSAFEKAARKEAEKKAREMQRAEVAKQLQEAKEQNAGETVLLGREGHMTELGFRMSEKWQARKAARKAAKEAAKKAAEERAATDTNNTSEVVGAQGKNSNKLAVAAESKKKGFWAQVRDNLAYTGQYASTQPFK